MKIYLFGDPINPKLCRSYIRIYEVLGQLRFLLGHYLSDTVGDVT